MPSVLRAIKSPPPIIAGGGLTTGSHLASLLTLGASGIVIGTRLTLTPESTIPQSKKESLAKVGLDNDTATIRSTVFDDIMGVRQKWPEGITGRGLKMAKMLEDESSGLDIEERRKRYNGASGANGSHEIIWAGTSIGLVGEILPAAVSLQI